MRAIFILILISTSVNGGIFYCQKPELICRLYHLLYFVDSIFREHSIVYWAVDGTLLGAIRHGGAIPWDDDIDLIVPVSELEKFDTLKFKDDLKNNGFFITPRKPGTWRKIYFSDTSSGLLNDTFPSLDIFEAEYKEGLYMSLSGFRLRGDIWSIENLFPLKRVNFGPVKVSVPCNSVEYLKRRYGKNCLKEAVIWSHSVQKPKKAVFKVFSPAKYNESIAINLFGYSLLNINKAPKIRCFY